MLTTKKSMKNHLALSIMEAGASLPTIMQTSAEKVIEPPLKLTVGMAYHNDSLFYLTRGLPCCDHIMRGLLREEKIVKLLIHKEFKYKRNKSKHAENERRER